MRRRVLHTALPALALLFVIAGCFGELTEPTRDNPLDPRNPDTDSKEPPRPTGLAAVVSDRTVVLTWVVDDTSRIDHYNVYRWAVEEEEEADFDLIDTLEANEYRDESVQNGQEYAYKVSGVNGLGLEGKLSEERRVTPRVFSVAIEQGRPKTSSRTVTLTLSASSETELMQVSNSSDMAGAQWQPYQASYSWELTSGDGTKTVYARFRDSEDNESAIVSDDIELDTRANIVSLTEDTEGEVKFAGDVIHFAMETGEPYGTASVDIGMEVPGIQLYDDGTNGDAVADDGIYERDYVIDHGVEAIDAAVTGYFTDDVGNDAEPELAAGTVTIHEPPDPVTMNEPVPLSERRIVLSWSRSTATDFGSYKLYRSYVPGVDTSTQRELLAQISSPAETDYTDTGLEPDSTYYYAIYVIDDIGLSAVSNEVAGTTLANEPPQAVDLYPPWAPDSTSLALSWSESDDDYFSQYELIGWEQDPPNPPNSADKRVIARITDVGETFYTHTSLIDTIVYWYQVAVIDSFGARAVSDSVSGSPRPAGE